MGPAEAALVDGLDRPNEKVPDVDEDGPTRVNISHF